MLKKDELIASEKWSFDENVTEVFEDMLERSIPDYLNMRMLVNEIIKNYQIPNSCVLDLGCSTGGAIEGALGCSEDSVRFIGLEISKPMLEKAKQKLNIHIENNKVEIIECDLRNDFPANSNSVVLSILTIQFIPIEYRQLIISNVFKSLVGGGYLFLWKKY